MRPQSGQNPSSLNSGHAVGTMAFEFFTPSLAQIVQSAGAQFLLYDMEHSGADVETMKWQFAACRGLDLVPLVRVPATEYHSSRGCSTRAQWGSWCRWSRRRRQAARIVSFTRYPPARAARRGVRRRAARRLRRGQRSSTRCAAAHERTLVICLVETEVGIRKRRCDRRGAPASTSCGSVTSTSQLPGHSRAVRPPRYQERSTRSSPPAIVMARRRVSWRPTIVAADYRAKGFRCIAYGVDVQLLQKALAAGIARLG
jgi:2-keto-3-deoxy-L-rhamnonate aldolase RhmA